MRHSEKKCLLLLVFGIGQKFLGKFFYLVRMDNQKAVLGVQVSVSSHSQCLGEEVGCGVSSQSINTSFHSKSSGEPSLYTNS